MAEHRRRGAPRQRGYLRRAFELAQQQRDVPLGQRLDGVGVKYDDAEGFVAAIADTGIPFDSLKEALKMITSAAADDEVAKNALDDLTQICLRIDAGDPGAREAYDLISFVAKQTAYAAAIEGFIAGVAYVAERGRTRNSVSRNRPGR
jgi:hypothetical protein